MKNYGEGIIAIGEELSQLLQLVSISQCEFLWSRILGYRIRDWKEKKIFVRKTSHKDLVAVKLRQSILPKVCFMYKIFNVLLFDVLVAVAVT